MNPTEILINNLKASTVKFVDVIATIDALYEYTPTAFKNGAAFNDLSQNQGSAKVFSFAQLNNLPKQDTLLLFVEHYQAVLANPEGNDHQNIRQFIENGWEGIQFEGVALQKK
jgi:hypothetical protein